MKWLSRKYLWVLVLVILISMLGLITIQSYWIVNSYKIKEKSFNYQVNKALSDVIKELETQETIFKISNEAIRLADNKDSLIEQSINTFDDRVSKQNEDLKSVASRSSVVLSGGLLGLDSNLIISDIQSSDKKEMSNSINISSSDVKSILKNKVNNQTLFVEKIVNQLINYNEDIVKRLDKVDLQSMIDKSLKNHDIDINFEFAVRSGGKRVCATSDFLQQSSKIYTKKLFPNNLFHDEDYLEIYIPHRTATIVKSMIPIIAISLILTSLIIGIVFYIFFIILKQKKLSEIKNDFVNNLTHELKTPIATISLASQMLSDKDIQASEGNITRYAGIIGEESKRLTKQVEKVLQIALIDKGNLKLKNKKIELNQFIEKIRQSFVLKVEDLGGEIDFNLSKEEIFISADELHLGNVITNLIDNAIKYKSDIPKIKIELGQTANQVFFSVTDNGIGISKVDQLRIFEKFYRVESGNIHNIKGFGLGLSYVKKIVDIYGGNIDVKSKVRQGTCFTVYLPKSDFTNK